MAIKVRIPTPLLKLTKGESIISVDGKSIKEIIDKLDTKYPGLKDRILDDGVEIRRFVNLYVNDEDVRFLNGLNTQLKDGDEVSIIPAIAGGNAVKCLKKTKEKRSFYLTYPPVLIKEPIIYNLGHKFKVITNIKNATIKGEIGLVAVELEGRKDEIEKAVKWLESKKIKVDPIEQDVVEG